MAFDMKVTDSAVRFMNNVWPLVYQPQGASATEMAELAGCNRYTASKVLKQLTQFDYLYRIDHRCWVINLSAIKDPILTAILTNTLKSQHNGNHKL